MTTRKDRPGNPIGSIMLAALAQSLSQGLCNRRAFLNTALAACALAFATDALAAPCPAPGAAARNWPRRAQIDRIAEQALAAAPMAGLSIAVVRDDRIIHAAGYGRANLELSVAASPETVYRVGSLTKQFTAAAILRLAELGQLRLEDDFRKFIPEYDTGGRAITIRQLLDHTSGIASLSTIGPAMANSALDVTRPQVFAWLTGAPFDFEPGERYRYNNSGYWLLGVLIEKVTGEAYATAIKRLLLDPLCLGSSRYDVPSEIIPLRASGYIHNQDRFLNAPPNSPTRPYAAGALVSTVLDLAVWQQALFGGQVLKEDSVRMMTTRGRLNNGQPTAYGLGLALTQFEGQTKIAHPGGIVGFSAYMSYYPDQRIMIVVLSNTAGVELGEDVEEPVATLLLAP